MHILVFWKTRTWILPILLRQTISVRETLKTSAAAAAAGLAAVCAAWLIAKLVLRINVIAFGLGDTLFWTVATAGIPLLIFFAFTIDLLPLLHEKLILMQLRHLKTHLQKNLRASRIAKTPVRYLHDTLIQTLLVPILVIFAAFLSVILGFSFEPLLHVPDMVLWLLLIFSFPGSSIYPDDSSAVHDCKRQEIQD